VGQAAVDELVHQRAEGWDPRPHARVGWHQAAGYDDWRPVWTGWGGDGEHCLGVVKDLADDNGLVLGMPRGWKPEDPNRKGWLGWSWRAGGHGWMAVCWSAEVEDCRRQLEEYKKSALGRGCVTRACETPYSLQTWTSRGGETVQFSYDATAEEEIPF
jgi:hypothetical protein